MIHFGVTRFCLLLYCPVCLEQRQLIQQLCGSFQTHCTEKVQCSSERELKIKDEEANGTAVTCFRGALSQGASHPCMKSPLFQRGINHSFSSKGEKASGATQPQPLL